MRAGVLYEEEKGGELAGLINAREGGEAKEEGYSRKEWVAEPNAQTIPDFSGKSYTQTKWDRREYVRPRDGQSLAHTALETGRKAKPELNWSLRFLTRWQSGNRRAIGAACLPGSLLEAIPSAFQLRTARLLARPGSLVLNGVGVLVDPWLGEWF